MEKGSWKNDRQASWRRGVGVSRHRERPLWDTDQEDACCAFSVSQIAQAFETPWAFTMRSDLHGWAWGGGALKTPKLPGKWDCLHVFRFLVKGIWNFHQILKGILDPKGLNCQCDKAGDYHTELMRLRFASCTSAVTLLTNKLGISGFLCCHH